MPREGPGPCAAQGWLDQVFFRPELDTRLSDVCDVFAGRGKGREGQGKGRAERSRAAWARACEAGFAL